MLEPSLKDEIARVILAEIADANGGAPPSTIWHWRRVARRFGVRIMIVPRGSIPAPILRYDMFLARAKLYLPHARKPDLLASWLTHEMAEAALIWTGCSTLNYAPEWGDHHALAVVAQHTSAKTAMIGDLTCASSGLRSPSS